MRNLASIQTITNISPIKDADAIEVATVLGWDVVVKKNEVSIGDKVVYFEIDSFLPIRPEFEFLRNSSYRKTDFLGEGFRLRTIKLRGQISQGLVLPISIFGFDSNIEVGTDVTDILGVKKWEVPERITSSGTIIGDLPYSIPHTDETRIQAFPELLNEFRGLSYYITTKMDGSSHSISMDKNGFHVTGHRIEFKNDGTNGFYEWINAHNLEEKLREHMKKHNVREITIQGELCSPGIQKNRLKLNKPEWYVFTVMIDGIREDLDTTKFICEDLGLTMVPIEEVGKDLPEVYPTIEDLLKRADGSYPNGGAKEGIVIRPITPTKSEILGDYLSMKVLNNKYLLKYDE